MVYLFTQRDNIFFSSSQTHGRDLVRGRRRAGTNKFGGKEYRIPVRKTNRNDTHALLNTW